MPNYVDGFVIPVPKSKLPAYVKMAKQAAKVWLEHGALDYVETASEDASQKGMVTFPVMAGCKKNETVVFAWIVYKSKSHRNAVNEKVMKDKRIAAMMSGKPPFDFKRMAYGGFKVVVQG